MGLVYIKEHELKFNSTRRKDTKIFDMIYRDTYLNEDDISSIQITEKICVITMKTGLKVSSYDVDEIRNSLKNNWRKCDGLNTRNSAKKQ